MHTLYVVRLGSQALRTKNIFILFCALGHSGLEGGICIQISAYLYESYQTIDGSYLFDSIGQGWKEISNVSSSVHVNISRVSAANELDIMLNTRRDIPCLQAAMYYFVFLCKDVFDSFPKIPKDSPKILPRPQDFEYNQRLLKTFEEDTKMFRAHTNKFKYSLRPVKHDISEVINIFTNEDVENTSVPDVASYQFYEWCMFQYSVYSSLSHTGQNYRLLDG